VRGSIWCVVALGVAACGSPARDAADGAGDAEVAVEIGAPATDTREEELPGLEAAEAGTPEPADEEATPEPEVEPGEVVAPEEAWEAVESAEMVEAVEIVEPAEVVDVAPDEPAAPAWVEVPRTSLADGFHRPLVRPADVQPFALIEASDPQLWWNFIDGDQSDVPDDEIEAQNQHHVDAMNALIAGQGLPEGTPAPIAVVMNGDLTEYGRWAQWDAYYRLYEGVEAPIFDGLGNHDYENNNEHVADGCGMDVGEWQPWRKACDQGSTQTLWGQSACEVADSIKELWSWCATDTMRRTRWWLETHAPELRSTDPGSGSYSWELGGYHFVQLHDYPGYQVPETQICSGLPWLRQDLADAVARDKWIVLHMHRPTQAALRPVLVPFRHRVVGIFFGHIHERVGYTGDYVVEDVAIPQFYSGSVQWSVFALAAFHPDRLTVTSVASRTGTPLHHASAAEYVTVGAGATVAAPYTRALPLIDCPPGQVPIGAEGACEAPVVDAAPIDLCY